MRKPFVFFLVISCCTFSVQATPNRDCLDGHPQGVHLDTLAITPRIRSLGVGLSKTDASAIGSSVLADLSCAIETRSPKWSLLAAYDVLSGKSTFFRRAAASGFDRRHARGHIATRWRGRWTWRPLPSATLTMGKDTLHDGWGRRSLFRGGHAAPTAFAQVALNSGGRLRYRHRIEALQGAFQMDCAPGALGDAQTWLPPTGRLRTGVTRWAVSHRIELDFGQRLTGALWGAVVWDAAERNFEPHYLVPLTSLRPTEYAQGSSDNALVGAEGRIQLGAEPKRPRALYGQFLLDELIVSELLGGTQWWGNKFGWLAGIQWGTKWGGCRFEFSGARPWTYSHFTSSSAYIHGKTPLAHPLGANFGEFAAEGHWKNQRWEVHLRATGSVRGDRMDVASPTGSLPQVGDISRTEETYTWLNGVQRKRVAIGLDLARHVEVNKTTSAQAFGQILFGSETPTNSAIVPTTEWWVSFGIRTTGPFFGSDW